MSLLQIWNYLGLGRIRKRSFLGLGGLKIILTKFFTVYWILVWHFGTVWSRKIEICNKIFRNISSNIYSPTLPKRPISKINLCYCFFNQCDNGLGMARRYWKIPSESWGVGQYPPRCPEAKPTDEGGIALPRRMKRVFSNTSEPCWCH